ncbi:hypothetical protein Tco_0063643, partial [Tanacetum coccineum]
MDFSAFIHVADPTKVRVAEKERAKGEARILDSTVGRVVPLLPVAPARAESELEASVDRLFDEGGSADQGDSAAGDGQEAETKLVAGVRIIVDENVVAEKPKRPRKKRQAVTDASGSSHPPKFVISSDSSHHSSINAFGAEADSVIRSAVVPPVMTEAVITSYAVNAPSVLVSESGTKIPSLVHASMFHDSDSIKMMKADTT